MKNHNLKQRQTISKYIFIIFVAVLAVTILTSWATDNLRVSYEDPDGSIISICGDENGWVVEFEDGKVDAYGVGYSRDDLIEVYKLSNPGKPEAVEDCR